MKTLIIKGYQVSLCFGEEDAIYIAKAEKLAGCITHGETKEEAIAEMKIAIDEHIRIDKQDRLKMKKVFEELENMDPLEFKKLYEEAEKSELTKSIRACIDFLSNIKVR